MCLLTVWMGGIGLVLYKVLYLVLSGVPFLVLIVGLSLVVEGTQVWFIVFWLAISAPGQMICLAKKQIFFL